MDHRVILVAFYFFVIHKGSSQDMKRTEDGKHSYDLVVILPKDNMFEFSLSRILPGINIAAESKRVKDIVPNIVFNVMGADSGCDTKTAPLVAIDTMINKTVDAFLGPVCDYAAAPIARYANHWKKPVITAGGQARAFINKHEYFITRTFLVYSKTGEALADIVADELGFNQHLLIYRYDPNDITQKDCFFITNGFHDAYMKKINNFDIQVEWFREEDHDFKHDILKYMIYDTRGMLSYSVFKISPF
ncbi:atrial natriuretic peptide receptor 3-like [Amphiura filiformis]|uniref:atrial natriuretic peptide receptor 3-like n=1 Tax=Amphiura filiformis TaxID=82378 RepID=UPI003B22718A